MVKLSENGFFIALTGLKLIGLYPSNSNSFLSKIHSYTLFLLFEIIIPVFAFIKVIYAPRKKTQVDLVPAWLFYTVFIWIKFLWFMQSNKRIRNCLKDLDSLFIDEEDYVRQINIWVKSCVRSSLICAIGAGFCIVVFSLRPLIIPDEVFPVEAWIPYDPFSNRFVFYLTYLLLALAPSYDLVGATFIDIIFGGLVSYCTSELQILKQNLQNLEHSKNSHQVLRSYVQRYDHILRFVHEIQECFSITIISQCGSSISTSGFLIVNAVANSSSAMDLITGFSLCLIIQVQLFVYCYRGQVIFEESNTLRDAIYFGHIFDLDGRTQKALWMMMERSKMPLLITVGSILNLNFDTFIKLLKLSYSTVTFLLNMQ